MREIPYFKLSAQHEELKKEIDTAIQQVLERDHFILGPEGEALEKELASYLGTRFAVGVASGTDAITLALIVAGVKAGDEVITTSNTATPTVVAISRARAIPVFTEIEAGGFHMDPTDMEKRITNRTGAILPVHLYGQPANMDPILEIGMRYGVPIVEDACQAHGACYKGKRVGSFGLLGCFSFYPTKNLGCLGDGGMITLDDESIYRRLLRLRNYGQKSKYEHLEVGMNSRLDELQAAVLRVKLKYLDEWNIKRRDIAEFYSQNITNPAIIKPVNISGRESVFHIYPVKCRERDALRNWLESCGVRTLIHYPTPIHLQAAFAVAGKTGLSRSEEHAKEVLSLPVYPEMLSQDLETVCERINQFQPSY